MKKIDVTVGNDGTVVIDLAGDLDNDCCGLEAERLRVILKSFGVELDVDKVYCCLSVAERVKAKMSGICKLSPLKADARAKALERRREP